MRPHPRCRVANRELAVPVPALTGRLRSWDDPRSARPAAQGTGDVEGRGTLAAAWRAEPLLRFLSTALGGRVAGAWVNEDGFIAATAEPSAVVEGSIAVGPAGTCACTVSVGDTHLASTAPDVRSFERVVRERLEEVGVPASGQQP